MISALEKSSDGKRKRRYDEALLPLLDRLPGLSPGDASSALAELGAIDPLRWEAPALLAGLNGDGRGYETAAKFLEIAVRNAREPAKPALEKIHNAAVLAALFEQVRSGIGIKGGGKARFGLAVSGAIGSTSWSTI